MSEQESEGLVSDLGDMWDAGVSAAGHVGAAVGDFEMAVVDDFQAGAQGVLGVVDYALGDPEGGDQHFDAALENAGEVIDDVSQGIDEIF